MYFCVLFLLAVLNASKASTVQKAKVMPGNAPCMALVEWHRHPRRCVKGSYPQTILNHLWGISPNVSIPNTNASTRSCDDFLQETDGSPLTSGLAVCQCTKTSWDSFVELVLALNPFLSEQVLENLRRKCWKSLTLWKQLRLLFLVANSHKRKKTVNLL